MMAENEDFVLDFHGSKNILDVSTSSLRLFRMSKKSKEVVCMRRNMILDGVP